MELTKMLLLVEPNIMMVIETFIFVTILWLIFKKKYNPHKMKLTESEKESIINSYKPDRLIENEELLPHLLQPHIVSGKAKEFIWVDGVKCINFASHNYLGLIGNVRIENKAIESIEKNGVGTCGPRCFYGTNVVHLDLEKKLADFLGTESAIVYPFGFSTIASIIPAYAKIGDVVFVDENRNFAIQQGLVASRSKVKYFNHNNAKDLERILREVYLEDLLDLKKAVKSRRFLVLEGIYVNTGEVCSLPDFIKLSKLYKLRVIIDESISIGVLGKTGRGILEHFSVSRKEVDLTMGSFEYSLASGGGFCAGSHFLVDHQVLSSQGYLFSASLPPFLIAAADEALRIVRESPETLRNLNSTCALLHDELISSKVIKQHFTVSGSRSSPIHLLKLKANGEKDGEEMLNEIMRKCLENNVAVTKAAKLTIDKGLPSSCLRVTTSVFHTQVQIAQLIKVLDNICKDIL